MLDVKFSKLVALFKNKMWVMKQKSLQLLQEMMGNKFQTDPPDEKYCTGAGETC